MQSIYGEKFKTLSPFSLDIGIWMCTLYYEEKLIFLEYFVLFPWMHEEFNDISNPFQKLLNSSSPLKTRLLVLSDYLFPSSASFLFVLVYVFRALAFISCISQQVNTSQSVAWLRIKSCCVLWFQHYSSNISYLTT